MYHDYYLRFDSEDAAEPVLFDITEAQYDEDGELVAERSTKPKYLAMDVIGVINKRTGGTDEEPVFAALDGWHINIRHDAEAPELEPYSVLPDTPYRVWG